LGIDSQAMLAQVEKAFPDVVTLVNVVGFV
jgi:hypothetical protein